MISEQAKDQDPGLDLSAYRELYLDEARKFLTIFRQSLTRLTDHPNDRTAWQEARRAAHTLKGMSSTMHYEALVALATGLEAPFLSDATLATDEIDALLARSEAFEHGMEH